jgi:hypothetical protein
MRTEKGIYLIIFSLIFLGVRAKAQGTPVLEKFSIDELNGKVLLDWTISAGATCNGIAVQRASDTLSFIEIGSLEGVCGNLSFPTEYAFTDEAPIPNVTNYYRLELGGNGFSQMVSILVIDLSVKDYALYPIPLTDAAYLHFRNDGLRKSTLSIFDNSGQTQSVQTDETEVFTLYRSVFQSGGMYHFTIQIEGTMSKITGKILVH